MLERALPLESTGPLPVPVHGAEDAGRAIDQCHALLSEQGVVSGERLAREALTAYQALGGESLTRFFDLLARGFSPDPLLVSRLGDAYRQNPGTATLIELQRAVESPRQELFRRLNLARGGTAALIGMRGRILRDPDHHPQWAAVAADLGHLLQSWFNGGFLEFKRIDWRTPPAVLENLIKFEAVHQIRDWRDLRRRLQEDRRCFGLFHPALPTEPLVFTELALTAELSTKVQPLLDPDSPVLDPAACRYAVFYSISSCHEGLRGVSFGNLLIRRVVDTLRGEFRRLKTFATLSPVPGFRAWLARAAREGNRRTAYLVAALNESDWLANSADNEILKRELVPLCAAYLLHARRGVEPADPVARFHLGNGARLERINWLGDTSAAGIDHSAGLMANYVYRLPEIERNHEGYVSGRRVAASRRVKRLATSRR